MRRGYQQGSAISFLRVVNLGGIAAMLVAGLLGAAMVALVRRPAPVAANAPRVDSEAPELRR